MDNLDLIAVGEIVKAQGIRGEVKVIPLTDNPKRFEDLKRVYFRNNDVLRELRIIAYRLFKEYVLVTFDGVQDMNAAEALGTGLIYIPKQERPRLPEGRYYLDEIEGLQVITITGELLGKIEQILQTGSNDVYIVRGNGREVLIPALRSVVQSIDLKEGKMLVELPPGLMEE